MKKLLLLLFLIPNLVMALPPCPEGDNKFWNKCKGTKTYSDGSKYVGEYKDGKSNGQGTYTFASGDKYVGEIKDGQINGQGTYIFANGDKYVGENKDGQPNGQGTYTHSSGDKYKGEYKDGKSNGQGTYTFANGNQYVGEFKDDLPNGQGTLTSADGKILKGKFINGTHSKEKALKTSVSATNFQLPPIDIQKTTIEQIIWDDGQIKLPVEGGWGYSKDDALVINKNHANVDQSKKFYGIGIEKKYVRYRAWKELELNENHYFVENKIKYKQKNQALIKGEGDKLYDLLKYEICAQELFLNDKGEHIKSDILLCYDTEYWFEISSFFGK